MDKKVVSVVCSVLAFFAGAIVVSKIPVLASLIIFITTAVGFLCGRLFNRAKYSKLIEDYEASVKKYKEETTKMGDELLLTLTQKDALEEELNSIKEAAKVVATDEPSVKSTPKVVNRRRGKTTKE